MWSRADDGTITHERLLVGHVVGRPDDAAAVLLLLDEHAHESKHDTADGLAVHER